MKDISSLISKVNSKETFLEFVQAMAADWEEERRLGKAAPSNPYGPGAKGWENISIGAFLKAMHAWATDADEKVPSDPNWKTFAQLLLAGKSYE